MHGYGGNDALSGSTGKDTIYGDAGDDLIGGGAGSDTIYGGDGNDTILSATTLGANPANKPTDSYTLPPGASAITRGPTWAVYNTISTTSLGNITIGGGGPLAQDSAPDTVDAGAGNDIVVAGKGADSVKAGAGPVLP